jgi:hypothetical protein
MTAENNNKSKRDFQEKFVGISMLLSWIFCRSLPLAILNHLCTILPKLIMTNKKSILLTSLSESMQIVKIKNVIWIIKNLKKKQINRKKIKYFKENIKIRRIYKTFTLTMRWMIRKSDKDPNRGKKKWHLNLRMILITGQNHLSLIPAIMMIFKEIMLQLIHFQLLPNFNKSINPNN